MPTVALVHGNKDTAEHLIRKHFDPAWESVTLPPLVEMVHPLLKARSPDVIVFSLALDTKNVMKLAKLVCKSEELKETRKFYVDLTPESKKLLLRRLGRVGRAANMTRYENLRDDIGRLVD